MTVDYLFCLLVQVYFVLPRKIYAKLIIEAAQKLSSLQEFADLSICAATRDCFF